MTDPICVTYFVDQLMHKVFHNWNRLTGKQQVEEIHRVVSDVHKMCMVPPTTLKMSQLNSKTDFGCFQPHLWKMEINLDTVPADRILDGMPISSRTVELAATIYHEARHCEQSWCLARFHAANFRSPSFLVQKYGIKNANEPAAGPIALSKQGICPVHIGTDALKNPMSCKDPLFDLTKVWAKSDKNTLNHELISYASIQLKDTSDKAYSFSDCVYEFQRRAHNTYANLPMEKDAFETEVLIKQAFTRYKHFSRYNEDDFWGH